VSGWTCAFELSASAARKMEGALARIVPQGTALSAKSHGMAGYIAAKHGVVGLMRYYASLLAEKNIRVNTVHPTGVATPMVVNDQVAQLLADQPEYAAALENLLPVPLIEPIDMSDAMVYLCGHSGRYITGTTLPVDAGYVVK